MEDMSTLLIFGIYVLLIFCLIFSFMTGVRIHQLGNKITLFESAYRKQSEEARELTERSIEKIEDLVK